MPTLNPLTKGLESVVWIRSAEHREEMAGRGLSRRCQNQPFHIKHRIMQSYLGLTDDPFQCSNYTNWGN